MHSTTWLELLYAYLISGGTLDATDNIKFVRTDLPTITSELKARVNTLTTFYAQQGVQEMFAASYARGLPLRHLAISTRLPSVSIVAHFPPALLRAVQLEIIKHAHKAAKGALRALSSRTTHKLQMAPWRLKQKFVMPALDKATHYLCENNIVCNEDDNTSHCNVELHLTCPRCGCSNDHSNRKLWNRERHKWLPLPCRSCKHKTAASKWACQCDLTWHKCPTHRRIGMESHGNRAVKSSVKRKPATLETITKRRHTVARNLAAGTTTTTPTTRCRVPQDTNDWAKLGAALGQSLNHTALRIRLMPPDGNCFYHAISYRLGTLGHHYSPTELKALAGATHGEEAEEHHIQHLATHPVPLHLRFVPVNAAVTPLTLDWDALLDIGCQAAPQLTLVRWTHNGVGKHFDVLEFCRPSNLGATCSNTSSNTLGAVQRDDQCHLRVQEASTPRRGTKRKPHRPTTTRKLFRLVDGKIVRIRHDPDGSNTTTTPLSEACKYDRLLPTA